MTALRTSYHNKLQQILTETEAGNGTLGILFLRARGDCGVSSRVPPWEVNANLGLKQLSWPGGVGPRYLSVRSNLNCSTNAVKFKTPSALCYLCFLSQTHSDFPPVAAWIGGDQTRPVLPMPVRAETWGPRRTAVSITMPIATEAFVNGLGGLPENLPSLVILNDPRASFCYFIKI